MQTIQEIGSLAVAITAVEMSGLPSFLPESSNPIATHFKRGVLYNVADNVVDWWMGKENDLIGSNMDKTNLLNFVDKSVQYSATLGIAVESGVVANINASVGGSLPFGSYNGKVISAGILVGAKTALNALQNTSLASNPVLNLVLHPTQKLR